MQIQNGQILLWTLTIFSTVLSFRLVLGSLRRNLHDAESILNCCVSGMTLIMVESPLPRLLLPDHPKTQNAQLQPSQKVFDLQSSCLQEELWERWPELVRVVKHG